MDVRQLFFPRNLIALANLVTFLKKYGLVLGKRTELQYAQAILEGESVLVADLVAALGKYESFKTRFTAHLENVINNLDGYIPGYSWRPTQRESLVAIVSVLQKNYTRPVVEMPTGSGKSLVIGAIARAFLDACSDAGIDQYVYIGTSRSNVVSQMMGYEQVVSQVVTEDDEEESINIGDVRLMLRNLDENDFRIIPETKSQKAARGKYIPKITISTNHALTPESFDALFPIQKPGFIFLDECHHTTARLQMILRQIMAFFFGYSATTLGPQFRSPFELFDPIAETEQDYERVETFEDLLAYHKSLAEMIAEGELKPVRYIQSEIRVLIPSTQFLLMRRLLLSLANMQLCKLRS